MPHLVILYTANLDKETDMTALLNHPANGVAWLASKYAPWGEFFEAGEIVLGGSFNRTTTRSAG